MKQVEKEIKEVDGIIGNTCTKIKHGNKVLCTINATHKLNNALLADLIYRLTSFTDEEMEWLYDVVKFANDKPMEMHEKPVPKRIKRFVELLKDYR